VSRGYITLVQYTVNIVDTRAGRACVDRQRGRKGTVTSTYALENTAPSAPASADPNGVSWDWGSIVLLLTAASWDAAGGPRSDDSRCRCWLVEGGLGQA
jgi:hypothetical protein